MPAICYQRDMCRVLLAVCLFLSASLASGGDHPDWTTTITPFQIADNLYYVGSRDLASYLVVTPKGNILLNANLETSPPQIRASVEKLGFQWADTKILLNAQAHFDHAAGAAEIVRETHAKNYVMEGDVDVMESGGKKDFLASSGSVQLYPPAHVDHTLHDGEVVSLGGISLTAHRTAGHTRGCTTWTMRAHLKGDPASVKRNVVIVGGTSFWGDFRFVDKPGHPASYPGIAQDFANTFKTLHGLHAEVFLGAHGVYFDMLDKLKRYPAEGEKVFIDPAGYEKFVNEGQAKFEAEVAKERTTKS